MKKLIFITSLIITSCSVNYEVKKIEGVLKSVEIEHKIESFSYGKSNEKPINILFNLEITGDNLDYENIKSKLNFSFDNRNNSIKFPPIKFKRIDEMFIDRFTWFSPKIEEVGFIVKTITNEISENGKINKIRIKCQLVADIYGSNLKESYQFYKNFLESNLILISQTLGHKNEIEFHKSNDFKVYFVLDGEIINKNNTYKMNIINPVLLSIY